MHNLALGKRNEFKVWAWLIDEGFDVYPSLVDDKGIDGLIGVDGQYFEIQVKSGKNWLNQRGISKSHLEKSLSRIYLILNYTTEEVRFFSAQQILNEPEWSESIQWPIPQIKLNTTLLNKYKNQDWNGLIDFLKSKKTETIC